ncbi:MAG: hypothetical protein KAS32_06580 [Candidatus Peribacteraceae bacterium]|nr:hypothetical protein [Candidatus Peribacteraceae bacterium]
MKMSWMDFTISRLDDYTRSLNMITPESEGWTEEDQAASEPDFYGKWVDVDVEMPPEGRHVLTWGADENPIIAHRDNGEWRDYELDDWVVGISHWMLLPPPPPQP